MAGGRGRAETPGHPRIGSTLRRDEPQERRRERHSIRSRPGHDQLARRLRSIPAGMAAMQAQRQATRTAADNGVGCLPRRAQNRKGEARAAAFGDAQVPAGPRPTPKRDRPGPAAPDSAAWPVNAVGERTSREAPVRACRATYRIARRAASRPAMRMASTDLLISTARGKRTLKRSARPQAAAAVAPG